MWRVCQPGLYHVLNICYLELCVISSHGRANISPTPSAYIVWLCPKSVAEILAEFSSLLGGATEVSPG